MSGEKQTCGRRMGELGPWQREENLDTWDDGAKYWNADVEAVRAANRAHEEASKNAAGEITSFRGDSGSWKSSAPIPRICSFCGGVHYDDLLKLLEAGWTIEMSTKSYKAYIEPPKSEAWSPAPPVKAYVQHFNQDQVEDLNRRIAMQKVTR